MINLTLELSRRAALLAALLMLSACAGATTPPGTGPDTTTTQVIPPGPYVPGQAYFGRNNNIEYVAGNAPVIYTAPHGGTLSPTTIPDRVTATCGVAPTTGADLNTADLVRKMQQRHFARFGNYPHIVINNLHRRKLDANRPLSEAACGNTEAATAFNEWHAFLAVAMQAVRSQHGKGWYMDMHGHGHANQRLELGWLLSTSEVQLSNAALDASPGFEDVSSVQTLSRLSPLSFSALLRGPSSLGTLYANQAFPAVPSASDPAPVGAELYFSGGYNTSRYSCGSEAASIGGMSGGTICGVQIEANLTGVRDTDENRTRFADATALVLEQFLSTHWSIQLSAPRKP